MITKSNLVGMMARKMLSIETEVNVMRGMLAAMFIVLLSQWALILAFGANSNTALFVSFGLLVVAFFMFMFGYIKDKDNEEHKNSQG